MNATEYLQQQGANSQVTFLIARAVKDETNYCYFEYRTTPIRCAWEWLEEREDGSRFGDDYIVINKDHSPIDINGHWQRAYQAGRLKCAVITTEAELRKMYSKRQADSMIEFYNKTIK